MKDNLITMEYDRNIIDRKFGSIWKFVGKLHKHKYFKNTNWSDYKKMSGWSYGTLIFEGKHTGVIVVHRYGVYKLMLSPSKNCIKNNCLNPEDKLLVIKAFKTAVKELVGEIKGYDGTPQSRKVAGYNPFNK